eukprot:TRINITY_DN105572_c0_g1_i1.p1 TRINITY_DN105572_c0_g1~~TRINITY_DN105572_c0_g1_i1.p1  ORF type:complete len:330 (+),score=86.11 TRINITY_DN105572_c0_g1_i1:41-1030(+)
MSVRPLTSRQKPDDDESDESDSGENAEAFLVPGLCCQTVDSGTVAVAQRCGKYVGYVEPGLVCYCWPLYTLQTVSLKVLQLDCSTECKTKDNVTLRVDTAIVYRINKTNIKAAVFEVQDAEAQMQAAVDHIVRAELPTLDLDDAYANKDTLCREILESLQQSMGRYGYTIVNAMVKDLAPDGMVLQAMNAINASKRQREAAAEQAEAQKILQVKAAEADAEAKYLAGVGIARMRKAMADGVKESMATMSAAGLSPQDAMHMMITTQYIDTMKDFATNPANTAIMVPSGAGAAREIEEQVRTGMLSANTLMRGQQRPPQQAMSSTVYAPG